jgi:hypothetical protein
MPTCIIVGESNFREQSLRHCSVRTPKFEYMRAEEGGSHFDGFIHNTIVTQGLTQGRACVGLLVGLHCDAAEACGCGR